MLFTIYTFSVSFYFSRIVNYSAKSCIPFIYNLAAALIIPLSRVNHKHWKTNYKWHKNKTVRFY